MTASHPHLFGVICTTGRGVGSVELRAPELDTAGALRTCAGSSRPSDPFFFSLRVCLSSSESIFSIAVSSKLKVAIYNPASITVSSWHSSTQDTFANLYKTALVRVSDRFLIKLLPHVSSCTSMFAALTDSVEIIKFVTSDTCQVTTKGSPVCRR